MPAQSHAPENFDSARLLFGVLIFALLANRGITSVLQPFSSDECMHLHNAWLVGMHQLPYMDYFDHHACGYHLMMGPFSGYFEPETSKWRACAFLAFARAISQVAGIAAVGLLIMCGWSWTGARCGLFAAALLLGNTFFLSSSIETRPDVLAMPFWLAGFGVLTASLSRSESEGWFPSLARQLGANGRWRAFGTSGVLFGMGIIFTQKLLFLLPGVVVTLLLWAMAHPPGQRPRARILYPSLTFLAGVSLPALAMWVWFCTQGGGGELIDKVLLINARWAYRDSPVRLIQIFLQQNPVFALLVVGAVFTGLRAMHIKRELDWTFVLTLMMFGGWLVGLCVIIPVAGKQFFLASLPLAALLAGKYLADFSAWSHNRSVTAVGWLLAICLPLSALPPYMHNLRQPDTSAFAATLRVMQHTHPTDTVLDGWTGIGIFRPQAWYYGYVHHEIPPMIPESEVRRFFDAILNQRVKPAVIAGDPILFALEPRLLQLVQDHYVHVPEARAYLRRDRYKSQASSLGQPESRKPLPSPSNQTEVRDK